MNKWHATTFWKLIPKLCHPVTFVVDNISGRRRFENVKVFVCGYGNNGEAEECSSWHTHVYI